LSVVITNLRAGPEQADHDQGVREAHLGAVHGTVAGALEHGEDVMVFWVEDYALDRGLRCVSASSGSWLMAHGSWRARPKPTQPCASFACAEFMSSTPEPPSCHSTNWGKALTCMPCSEDDMIEQSVLVYVLAVVVKRGRRGGWLPSCFSPLPRHNGMGTGNCPGTVVPQMRVTLGAQRARGGETTKAESRPGAGSRQRIDSRCVYVRSRSANY